MRFYQSVSQITGSYTQALQINDPDVIKQICEMQASRDQKVVPPWWRFTDSLHKLTDIADQLIASRAHGDDVKFYPRPKNPAFKAREAYRQQAQDDKIEASRRANAERRAREAAANN